MSEKTLNCKTVVAVLAVLVTIVSLICIAQSGLTDKNYLYIEKSDKLAEVTTWEEQTFWQWLIDYKSVYTLDSNEADYSYSFSNRRLIASRTNRTKKELTFEERFLEKYGMELEAKVSIPIECLEASIGEKVTWAYESEFKDTVPYSAKTRLFIYQSDIIVREQYLNYSEEIQYYQPYYKHWYSLFYSYRWVTVEVKDTDSPLIREYSGSDIEFIEESLD